MPDPGDEFWDQFDTHEMIMEATVWVLAEEGYQGLTLRKVAERAGKNRGLVHYYFDSKDDLLRSLLDHVLEGTKRLMGIDDEDAPSEKLWTVLEFQAYGPGGVAEHGRHYHIAIHQLQALAVHDPKLRKRFTRNHTYLVDLTAEIIAEGIEDGTFRSIDPEKAAVFLLAAIDGARNQDLSLDTDSARDTTLETIAWFESELLGVSDRPN
ncbi:TetR/AcrR family transcriptional regulator [Halosolutus gelatinilyticus]|uniref:TetR/AcrR family transcriptional regulator n=1 Tax=Halosolutus gelatinilyticus TaxID=2931975 RepID=UPI001FF10F19|nr:TetR/AcrR family transcriptional regulator [Halosolutus gelatinilyticus]